MKDLLSKATSIVGKVESKYDNARIGEYGTMFLRYMWKTNKKDVIVAAVGAAIGVVSRRVMKAYRSYINYGCKTD